MFENHTKIGKINHALLRCSKSKNFCSFVLNICFDCHKNLQLHVMTGKLCPVTYVYKLLFACKCAVGQISIKQHKHVTNYTFPKWLPLNKPILVSVGLNSS